MGATYLGGKNHSGEISHNYYNFFTVFINLLYFNISVSYASWLQPVAHCECKLNNIWLRIRTFKQRITIKLTMAVNTCSAKLQIDFKTDLLAGLSDLQKLLFCLPGCIWKSLASRGWRYSSVGRVLAQHAGSPGFSAQYHINLVWWYMS